jgi:hypothetical protein
VAAIGIVISIAFAIDNAFMAKHYRWVRNVQGSDLERQIIFSHAAPLTRCLNSASNTANPIDPDHFLETMVGVIRTSDHRESYSAGFVAAAKTYTDYPHLRLAMHELCLNGPNVHTTADAVIAVHGPPRQRTNRSNGTETWDYRRRKGDDGDTFVWRGNTLESWSVRR